MDKYLESVVTARLHASERIKQIIGDAEKAAAKLGKEEKRATTPEDFKLSPEAESDLEAANAAYDTYKAEEDKLTSYRARVEGGEQARASLQPLLAAMREDTSITSVRADLSPDGWFARATKEHDGTEYESFLTIPVGIPNGFQSRALNTVGGSAIATTFADFVTVYERTLNPMMEVATVLPTRSGNPITFPRVTVDTVAGGTITAEAAGITEGDPTINSVNLGAFKIAYTTLYSAELDQDEVIGLDSILANAISRPMGLGWGSFFTLGTGTTQPWGFLTRATNAGTALGTANGTSNDKYFSPTDAITLQYSLAAPYRARGSFMTNSAARVRSFKDANSNFIFQPSLQAGFPDAFLGRPIWENPAMVAAGSATTSIAFGDFSRYYIRDVQPMRVDISKDYKFNTDQLALRVVTRRDGDLLDVGAIKYLVSQAI